MEAYEKRRFLDPKEVYAQLQRLHDKTSWQEEAYQFGDSAYERREITLNAMACIDMLLWKIEELEKGAVYCKDCVYGEKCVEPYKDYWCNRFEKYFDGDWFCKDGAKRSDGDGQKEDI